MNLTKEVIKELEANFKRSAEYSSQGEYELKRQVRVYRENSTFLTKIASTILDWNDMPVYDPIKRQKGADYSNSKHYVYPSSISNSMIPLNYLVEYTEVKMISQLSAVRLSIYKPSSRKATKEEYLSPLLKEDIEKCIIEFKKQVENDFQEEVICSLEKSLEELEQKIEKYLQGDFSSLKNS